MCVCLCVVYMCRCPWMPEVLASLEAEIIGGCKTLDVGAGNQTRAICALIAEPSLQYLLLFFETRSQVGFDFLILLSGIFLSWIFEKASLYESWLA